MTAQVTSEPGIIAILNVETGEHEYFSRKIVNGDVTDKNGITSINAYRTKKRVDELLANNIRFSDPDRKK
ncbi:hypothetical protein ACOYX0_03535 [Enterococcus thailandicus]|uniref:hypothetical protein n=1 Tax=Enterococcus TaxID=1350 RepID=UPI00289072E1|nr:hypothetical protein [Enterococcus thailandicus]MDT2750937.1 hypothetical protein [Enterococcus thailandicus]MDT2775736.1 hypothetical protein [Enterococcus thailandicus]MDT2794598.1 hypothetical protein [Enterococcus thailandicus]MDT2845125.1 hypothetical protein [Enterococcus thailandicus]